MEEHLAKKQKEVNELYERDGLTDEVLDKQIAINKMRNGHNIPESKDFVQ